MSAAADYRFELLRSDAQLQALESDWRELYAATPVRNPFWSYDWVVACRATVGRGATPYVLTARREGRLVGVAPLRLKRERGFRVLRFIGDRRSDYQGFLLHPAEQPLEQLLLEELGRHSGDWDLALLRQLSEEHTGLLRTPIPGSLRARSSSSTVCPYVRLPEDWAGFCKSGPAALRRAIRAERKLRREGGTVEHLTDGVLAQHLDELAGVEARSWKGRRGTVYFQGGATRALIHQALSKLGARGEMELWLARQDGRAMAFQLNFVMPDRVLFYLGAYDEQHRRHFPGGILHFRSLQRLWQAGLREYDLLCGDEAYKFDWATDTRPLCHRAFFPARLRGYLAYALLLGARWRLKRYAAVRAADRFLEELRDTLGNLRRTRLRRVPSAPGAGGRRKGPMVPWQAPLARRKQHPGGEAAVH